MQTPRAVLWIVMMTAVLEAGAADRDYRFDGKMSREVLENYLARAVTFSEFLHGKGSAADNLRFLKWLREHDTNGWLQMPGSRTLHAPVGGQWWYWANTRSAATPEGFNQENTIKAIWAEHARTQ